MTSIHERLLTGAIVGVSGFESGTLGDVDLAPGAVRIFEVQP